jgi:ferredoxin
MKVKVDEDLCIGCGTCELMCSQCFQLEDGKAKVSREDCNQDDLECDIQDVIDSCPTEAIIIDKK